MRETLEDNVNVASKYGGHYCGTRRRVVAHDSYFRLTHGGHKVTVNVLTLSCGHVVKRENSRPMRCICPECGCELCV